MINVFVYIIIFDVIRIFNMGNDYDYCNYFDMVERMLCGMLLLLCICIDIEGLFYIYVGIKYYLF